MRVCTHSHGPAPMNHVHLPGAVGITPFVLVKVCQSPMCRQHCALSVRPTSGDRTCCALPPCWRAPICPSLGAASCAARLSGCWHAPPVPRSSVQHDRARPACVQRPARPTASMRPHGPQGLLCSSVPSEHGGDVDDCSSVTFLGLSVTFSVTPIEPQSLPQWTLYCDCKTHTGQGAAL